MSCYMDSYMNRPRRREGRGRARFVETDLLDIRSHLVGGFVFIESVRLLYEMGGYMG